LKSPFEMEKTSTFSELASSWPMFFTSGFFSVQEKIKNDNNKNLILGLYDVV